MAFLYMYTMCDSKIRIISLFITLETYCFFVLMILEILHINYFKTFS